MAYSPNFKNALNGFSKENNDLILQNNTQENDHLCRRCKNSAARFVCSRCGDFYCSENCQDIDWEQHRYLCTPKPRLVEVNSSQSKQDYKDLKETLSSLAHCCQSLVVQLQKLDILNCNEVLPTVSNDSSNNLNDDSTTRETKIHHADVAEAFEINKLHKEEELVVLISFVKVNRVAICAKNCYIDYIDVVKQVDLYGKTAPMLQSMPYRGQQVIVSRYGNYCRARIISIKNEDQVCVILLDYGSYVDRKFLDLRQITPDITNLPQYIAVANLKNVVNFKFSQAISLYTNSFKNIIFKMKSSDCNTEIELFDMDTGDSINDKIAKHLNGKEVYQKPNSNKLKRKNSTVAGNEALENAKTQPMLVAPFNVIMFSQTIRNAEAFIVDTTLVEHGYIACILEQHIDKLSDVQKYLNNNNNISDEPYVPQEGEYVIANFGHEWLRGKVVGLLPDDELFEISFIDFINQANISSQDIRRYPNDLVIDCHTQLCLIDGLPKTYTPKLKKFLKDEVALWDQIIIDRVVSVSEEEFVLIECKQILDRIFEQNII